MQSGIGPEKLMEDSFRIMREEGSLAGKGVEKKFADRSREVRLMM